MAENQFTNTELYQAIKNDPNSRLGKEIARLEKEGALTDEVMYNYLSNSASSMNDFINTLVNKCVMTQFFGKIYKNKLAPLHNGLLPYGDTIQQVYVGFGKRKGFFEHFDRTDGRGAGSPENDVLGKVLPPIEEQFISVNFKHKYKVTISNERLKSAFMDNYGLSRMIGELINSNLNGAYRDEYRDMLGILTKASKDLTTTDGHNYDKGLIYQFAEDENLVNTAFIPVGNDPKLYATAVREYAESLTFDSDKYNLAKVETWSDQADLIHITTSHTNAVIDVNVIASAFNVSATDMKIRTIIVDHLPKNLQGHGSTALGDVVGIVADKNILQAWDTVNTSRQFDNPDTLETSYWLHKQGIMSGCKFAQMVVLTNKSPE